VDVVVTFIEVVDVVVGAMVDVVVTGGDGGTGGGIGCDLQQGKSTT
jgi:hypothetical protein